MSQGEDLLGEVIRQEFRNVYIVPQHPIKLGRSTLFLDYFIPTLKLAFEYDGIQHFKYSSHMHGNRQGFEHSKLRDSLKSQWCEDNNVLLIRFSYKETPTVPLLRKKLHDACSSNP